MLIEEKIGFVNPKAHWFRNPLRIGDQSLYAVYHELEFARLDCGNLRRRVRRWRSSSHTGSTSNVRFLAAATVWAIDGAILRTDAWVDRVGAAMQAGARAGRRVDFVEGMTDFRANGEGADSRDGGIPPRRTRT